MILFNTSASPREGLRQWRWSLANISELGRVAASFDAVGSFTGPLLTGCRDHEDSKNTKAHEENLVCTKRIFLVSSCLRGHGRARYNAAHERSTRRC